MFACIYVPHYVPGTHGGQKTMPNLLKLELRIGVNHHVGARKQAQVLQKINKCSQL